MKETEKIIIYPWMISQLDLKGNELLVYAIIYGRKELSEERITNKILIDSVLITKPTLYRCIKVLLGKGVIKRIDRYVGNQLTVEYRGI